MNEQKLTLTPIAGALGVEITGVDLSQPLDETTFAGIHQAFLDHLVIVFHDQILTPGQTKAFARRFGPLQPYPFVKGLEDHPEIFEIRKEPDEQKNFGGNWHSDMSFTEIPPLGTLLYALEVPSRGGDTLLTNLYLAYETLSEGLQKTLSGMRANYSAALKFAGGRKAVMQRTQFDIHNLDQAHSVALHPVVRTHPETGRKALYISASHLESFAAMSEAESRPLLDYLRHHATNPDFSGRIHYRRGTLVLWDNRCTQHRALNDYQGERRVMHRLTIAGSERPC